MNNNQKYPTPLFSDIFNHFIENDFDITSAQAFYNHYSSKDWKNNENEPISEWKNEIKVWLKKEISTDS